MCVCVCACVERKDGQGTFVVMCPLLRISQTLVFFSAFAVPLVVTTATITILYCSCSPQTVSALDIAAISAGFVVAVVMIGTVNFGGPDREALTMQEFWWALRGNYLPTLLIHFIKYGGL